MRKRSTSLLSKYLERVFTIFGLFQVRPLEEYFNGHLLFFDVDNQERSHVRWHGVEMCRVQEEQKVCEEVNKVRILSCFKVIRVPYRTDSFFEDSRLTLPTIIYLTANWVENPAMPIAQAAEQFQLDKSTVTEFYEIFRDLIQQWFEREVNDQGFPVLGGPG